MPGREVFVGKGYSPHQGNGLEASVAEGQKAGMHREKSGDGCESERVPCRSLEGFQPLL